MSHCHDEHESHEHEDEHNHDGPDRGTETSLYSRIDRENVRCLNESSPGLGKNVIKPWHERNDTTKASVDSVHPIFPNNIHICNSFTGSVKLKSISIKSGPGNSCPSKMKAYINREDIDFDTVDSYTATQEWELISSPDNIEYVTRMTKMYNVRNLTLYFPENFGDDITRIFYIGLKGEWTETIKIQLRMKEFTTPSIEIGDLRHGELFKRPFGTVARKITLRTIITHVLIRKIINLFLEKIPKGPFFEDLFFLV
ncbi:339_t:CDS:2 [Gigaspora rosea]|nr:339_t:CDS:2 [Gigaspora rosea]